MIKFDDLKSNEKEVLGQLFLTGPTWDGNISSKTGRDELCIKGLVEHNFGWAWLTSSGVGLASDYKQIPSTWFGGRWRKKAGCS